MKAISEKRLQEIIDNRGKHEKAILELFDEMRDDFDKYADAVEKLLMGMI